MVDGTGLENRHTRKGIGGSNPSLSASYAPGPSARCAHSGFRLRWGIHVALSFKEVGQAARQAGAKEGV